MSHPMLKLVCPLNYGLICLHGSDLLETWNTTLVNKPDHPLGQDKQQEHVQIIILRVQRSHWMPLKSSRTLNG